MLTTRMIRYGLVFCRLIPAFHHHFGRQCRVADYGFTKLPDLLAALSNTIVVSIRFFKLYIIINNHLFST